MDIPRQRLTRTFLTTRPWTSGREVVHALGAVQAQDYEGAKWALAKRTVGLNDAALEAEFTQGEMIRTHVLRPTWHFVDPLDLRWMLALTGPAVMRRMAPYNRQLALDENVFRKCNTILERALQGGKHLTRAELKTELARARIGELGGQRLAHIVMNAELEALICSGPRSGKQFTYALVEERVAQTDPKDRDESLLELARRYFRSRSPATASDFNWWSGLSMADVRRAIELMGDEIEQITIGDKTYWTTGERLARPRPSAHLLPNYDEYFIGYRDRSAIGERLRSAKIVTGGSTLIAHVIAVDGQLVGGWKRSARKDAVNLDLKLMTKLTPTEVSRVRAEVKRFCSFIGRPVVTTGLEVRR